ncbi:HAD-IB family hydrolase [Sphingomonas tabacisoli]|uniref:HAD-IB family hydrolase n=1 Tax=Sphingomonas tabacisoli TaxID=2249466 RepID=A0ABW4I6F6_9SPHN
MSEKENQSLSASAQTTAGEPVSLAPFAWPFDPMAGFNAYAKATERMLNALLPEQKMSLDKLIQDIEQGPQGPRVIAAFDFDGTLIGGLSGGMLFKERMKRKEVSRDEITEAFGTTFKTMAKIVEANEMLAQAFARWAGKTETEMEDLGAYLFENAIQDSVFPEMLQIVAAHRRAGHTIVVATSASRFQAEATVRSLGIEHLLCSQLEVVDGKLTGKVVGETLYGKGKVAAIKRFVDEHGSSLADTHFYADGSEEVALMEAVGHPHPVNPGSELANAAKNHKWPVLRLTTRGSSKPVDFARNIAGLSTLMPILQTGLAVGAVTRDRRTLANTVMPTWMNMQLQMAGVKLRVWGRSNLMARRPAIFIFNHRNLYDGMFAAVLVKTDYVALAKKEMGNNPIGKLVQQLMPTVLLDREQGSRAKAAEALKPVIDAVQKEGYSVILAPEGTRTVGNLQSVGPFKKGAFHMAMAAGVPIIPIVIRNALDVAARNGAALRPGTVDVAVLPPIPVDDWTPRTMSQKIEEVRQLYTDTLANWPSPEGAE